MQTPAFIIRGSTGLILLALVFNICSKVYAETRPSEHADSACNYVVHNLTEQEQIKAEKPDITDDDLWLINTRHLGCMSSKDEFFVDLKVSHFSDSGDWIESEIDELLESDSRMTVIYLHGNRISCDEAISGARNAFAVLQRESEAPPMRLIIWSWPSGKICGQIRDFRSKAFRTDAEGQSLGWFLSRMNAETRVSLIGYSYGARIATGALHVLGGGTLRGQSKPFAVTNDDRSPINVVLIAAALHSHWLAPGGYHDRFSSVADHLLVLYNSRDPVLKRYRFIERCARPVAMGFSGAWGLDDDLADRTEQYDVRSTVGKTHTEAGFLSSKRVLQGLRQLVRLNAVSAKAIRKKSASLGAGP